MLHKLLNYISPGEAVSHSLLFFILPQGPKLASAAGLTYVPLAHGSAGFAIWIQSFDALCQKQNLIIIIIILHTDTLSNPGW